MGGLRSAEALRRFGYTGPITVIGDEPWAPYNRPPLSKEVLAGEVVSHETVAFPQRAATADVGWVLGRRVVSTDLEHNTVTTDDGEVRVDVHVAVTDSRSLCDGLRQRSDGGVFELGLLSRNYFCCLGWFDDCTRFHQVDHRSNERRRPHDVPRV
jgi:NAD(P)H-nitrite reductase large subunit